MPATSRTNRTGKIPFVALVVMAGSRDKMMASQPLVRKSRTVPACGTFHVHRPLLKPGEVASSRCAPERL